LILHYAKFQKLGFDHVQEHLCPFMSCYVRSQGFGLSGLIFALDGAAQSGGYI